MVSKSYRRIRPVKRPYIRPAFSRASVQCDGSHSPVDRKSTRLNSSHSQISYAVFCLKKKKQSGDASASGASSTDMKATMSAAGSANAAPYADAIFQAIRQRAQHASAKGRQIADMQRT